VFRTAAVGDVLTDDMFLDRNPPLWRFQLQGVEAFAAWYKLRTQWDARAIRISSASVSHRRVGPSTSVNRNVTPPKE